MLSGRTADMFTWNDFSTTLASWFVPLSKRRRLQEKYLRLIQGDRTVMIYERELTHLSRFAGTMQRGENEKCSRFVDGLRDSLRQSLMTMLNVDYKSLVDTARKLEAGRRCKSMTVSVRNDLRMHLSSSRARIARVENGTRNRGQEPKEVTRLGPR
ncbi:hypothetical protein KSP39_PZI014533 [Platanthera zijinensis]|uniref:Retrotransposon gag domain-containing protein n=1 Tax=Platanthera zijinensis TaxID=2320716 RepID=A0AAP0BAA4_9ASPA